MKVRELSYGEAIRLAADIGTPDMSQSWWRFASSLAAIREIDGREVIFPQTRDHIRDLAKGAKGRSLAPTETLERGTAPEIVVKSLDEVETLDFYENFGGISDVTVFSSFAQIACSVRSIDGAPVEMPKRRKELYALIDRLGEAGMDEAARRFVAELEDRAADGDVEADQAAAKN